MNEEGETAAVILKCNEGDRSSQKVKITKAKAFTFFKCWPEKHCCWARNGVWDSSLIKKSHTVSTAYKIASSSPLSNSFSVMLLKSINIGSDKFEPRSRLCKISLH